jgi:hypothetical protein
MRDQVAEMTAKAVATYDLQGEAYDAFYEIVKRDLITKPEAAIEAASPYLGSGEPRERAAAASIVGRIGEFNRGATAAACAGLLFDALLTETDRVVVDCLAAGLGLIWASTDNDGDRLELARHPNANVRCAAAHSLALYVTDDPRDAAARAVLEQLLDDPDEGVRGWAEFGLDTLTL